jgi:lantibiotic modifying enzyme
MTQDETDLARFLSDDFATAALRELKTRIGHLAVLLEESAWQGMRRTLEEMVTAVSWRMIRHSTACNRTADIDLAFDRRKSTQEGLGACLAELFREFPVFKQILQAISTNWIYATAETLERAWSDLSLLKSHFGISLLKDRLVLVISRLGDAHNGGRSVTVLCFTSGQRIVYRPRCGALDEAWGRLQEYYGALEDWPLGRRLVEVNRVEYSWQEWIAPKDIGQLDEATKFYRRCGSILCWLYILHATDMHRDNLIANGEWPQLIDLETLASPRPDVCRGNLRGWKVGDHSVYDTGLVPTSHLRLDMRDLPFPAALATRDNTLSSDSLRSEESEPLPRSKPWLAGREISPEQYVESIKDGFESMYRLILRDRKFLLGPNSPLCEMAQAESRVVIRGTRFYAAVFEAGLQPSRLRSIQSWNEGIRSILSKDASVELPPKDLNRLLKCEEQILAEGDIPRWVLSNSVVALERPQALRGIQLFGTPSFDRIRDRIQAASMSACEQQLALLHGCFFAG